MFRYHEIYGLTKELFNEQDAWDDSNCERTSSECVLHNKSMKMAV